MNRFLPQTENRYIRWALCGLLALIFLQLVATVGAYIVNPHFSEFREGHTFSSTYLLLKGVRPFTLETYPEYYNSYGILFNLVAAPFALLFGNTLILHRILNEVFFTGALAFLALYRRSWRFTFTHLIILVAAWGLLNYGTNNSVRPDGLGVFLYTVCIFLPLRRGFDVPGMLIAMGCALLAFYTKVYFVGCWYLLSVALLVTNWKKCLLYNLVFHALLALSCVVVTRVFPLYFYETVFAYSTSAGNNGSGMGNALLYSAKQFGRFFLGVLPFLLLAFVPFRKDFFREQRLTFLMLIPCALVLFYPLGANDGAFVTYHTHLMLPLLVPLALAGVRKESPHHLLLVAAMLCIIFQNHALRFTHNIPQCSPDAAKWEKIENEVANARHVLNSDCISYLLMRQDKPLVTDGVSDFVFGYRPSPVTQALFGRDEQLAEKKEQYADRIRTGIREKQFDLIILSNLDSVLRHFPDADMSGYRLIETIDIKQRSLPHLQFSVYKPIE